MKIAVVALCLRLLLAEASKDCIWKEPDFKEKPLLILDDGSGSLNHVSPIKSYSGRMFKVASSTWLIIACPGNGNSIKQQGLDWMRAKCTDGKLVDDSFKVLNMQKVRCYKKVQSLIKSSQRCGARHRGQESAIGFQTQRQFFKQILICFDNENLTTLYTSHVVNGVNLKARNSRRGSTYFRKDGYGYQNVDIETLYTKKSQSKTFTSVLGRQMPMTGENYLAKGHLTPDADFAIMAEQEATYRYMNAVPQWQVFNNGNWKALECSVRKLAMKKKGKLLVYTGTWDVLKLNNAQGEPVKMYLDETKGKKIAPVPAIMWKVIQDKATSKAVAVVGVNDPYLKIKPKQLCQNICSSISWIKFKTDDLTKGYIYCCPVSALRAAVPDVPNLGNVNLLD